jgi:BirA family biotin operon repressor/biotin-[acetyl-CoA-carboxylase] ligase
LDERHVLLPLAVPLAVCEAVESSAPVECRVKWPNDVWIGERKVAGVLIEARPPDWAVIGIGVNVSIEATELPSDLRWPATSIGHGSTVEGVLEVLVHELGDWMDAHPDRVLAAYRTRDALAGRQVRWEGGGGEGGEGVADGIDEKGNLEVVTAGGDRVSLGAGEVQLSL